MNSRGKKLLPLSVALTVVTLMSVLLLPRFRSADFALREMKPTASVFQSSASDSSNSELRSPQSPVPGRQYAESRLAEAYARLPLHFEANKGQTDSRVKFLARGGGYIMFLTPTEAVVGLRNAKNTKAEDQGPKSGNQRSAALRMKLACANQYPQMTGVDELPGKVNYFVGKNPARWRQDISTFREVRYEGVYPGIDVTYHGNQRQLEYDFVVAPGASPQTIRLSFEGAEDLKIDVASGDLVLRTAAGEIHQPRPLIYQEVDGVRHEIAGQYTLLTGKASFRNPQSDIRNRLVGFEIADYDTSRPLIIDPVLVYSTFLGGNGTDDGRDIVVDSTGTYVVGQTLSTNFPVNNAAFSTLKATEDAFVTKFNPAGSALIYSTYLGGTGTSHPDWGQGIAVDASGNAYVTGETGSTDFPTTPGAFQTTFGGFIDAYATKLSASGALVYSTFLGGTNGDSGRGIAVDTSGNAYVTGYTDSGNFPVMNPLQTAKIGFFLTKLNPAGSALVYSTYIGGGSERPRGIDVDATGNAYVVGTTLRSGFPVVNAFQPTFGGVSDAFLTRVNATGTALAYSTFLGGSAEDDAGNGLISANSPGQCLAIDDFGNAYVTGLTVSTNFPIKNAFQPTYGGGSSDAFVAKVNTNASGAASLVYSTYLGGNSSDVGYGIAVNVLGQAYVTGSTGSSNFPLANAIQITPNDMFVTKLNATGAGLVYSTYFGGVPTHATDVGQAMALDGAGNVFVTGSTSSSNYPTQNAFQSIKGSGSDAFVTVIADPTIIGRVVDENGAPIPGATVNLSGVPSATTSTDANGYFTFGLLTVGNNYMVSVSVPNYIFNSQSVNNLQKNVRLDFSPVVVTISGQVTLGSGGLDAVTMTLSGGKFLSTQTNASGNYSFPNLPAGRSYTVTPSKPAFGFVPTSSSFTNVLTNQIANFVASATIQFNVGSYVANEADGKATITITRTSGASGPASVRYSISDGTAKQKSDYILAFGTLRMAAGETSKSFQVLIVDDVYVEGDEFFFVTLSDPVGATLGTPNPAMVTITDNDTAPPTSNPIDQSRFFVQEHYYDFLSRYPDASGWDFWTNNINNCTPQPSCIDSQRINTSAAYFLSIEFQQTGYLVERIHKSAFGDASGTSTFGGAHQLSVPIVRFPDFISDTEEIGDGLVVGQSGWETVLENNKQAFTADFVQRTRFTTASPTSMTPAQFVDKLNTNAGNVLSAGDRATAIALFGGATDTSNTTARAQALRQVAEDQNLATAEFNRAFVLMQFFGYLRRNPNDLPDSDYTGYDFWLTKLNQFNGNYNAAEMVKAFIVSTEYRQRFGP